MAEGGEPPTFQELLAHDPDSIAIMQSVMDLGPADVIKAIDEAHLSSRGELVDMKERLIRFRIRELYPDAYIYWEAEEDERGDNLPFTIQALLRESSVDPPSLVERSPRSRDDANMERRSQALQVTADSEEEITPVLELPRRRGRPRINSAPDLRGDLQSTSKGAIKKTAKTRERKKKSADEGTTSETQATDSALSDPEKPKKKLPKKPRVKATKKTSLEVIPSSPPTMGIVTSPTETITTTTASTSSVARLSNSPTVETIPTLRVVSTTGGRATSTNVPAEVLLTEITKGLSWLLTPEMMAYIAAYNSPAAHQSLPFYRPPIETPRAGDNQGKYASHCQSLDLDALELDEGDQADSESESADEDVNANTSALNNRKNGIPVRTATPPTKKLPKFPPQKDKPSKVIREKEWDLKEAILQREQEKVIEMVRQERARSEEILRREQEKLLEHLRLEKEMREELARREQALLELQAQRNREVEELRICQEAEQRLSEVYQQARQPLVDETPRNAKTCGEKRTFGRHGTGPKNLETSLSKYRARKSEGSSSESGNKGFRKDKRPTFSYRKENGNDSDDSDYFPNIQPSPRVDRSFTSSKPKAVSDTQIRNIRFLLGCGIKFGGSEKESASEFLTKLENCRRSTGMTDDDLLVAAPVLLNSIANKWYESNQDEFYTWKDFRKALLQHFRGDIDDKELFDDLNRRTQHKQEKISSFISSFKYIVSHFRRPPSMADQLRIAYDNLLPEYRHYMMDKTIDSLERIKEYGRNWEKVKDRDSKYVPPPPREKMKLPGAAYSGPQSSKVGAVECHVEEEPTDVEMVASIRTNKPAGKSGPNTGNGPKNRAKKATTHSTPQQKVMAAITHASAIDYANNNGRRERPGFACYNCGSPDHRGIQCPSRICAKCYKTGHYAVECKGESSALARPPVTCHSCKQPGHYANTCPNRTARPLSEVRCHLCQGQGHYATTCPKRTFRPSTQTRCQNCGQEGVEFKTCTKCAPLREKMGNESSGRQTSPLLPQTM